MEQHRLICTGDPILDIYIDEQGEMLHFNGGALNIYQNILALLEDHLLSFESKLFSNVNFAYPGEGTFIKGDIFNCYTLLRTSQHEDGVAIASASTKDIFYTPCGVLETIKAFEPSIMVLCDYNKGVLNTHGELGDEDFEQNKLTRNAKYIIVDSRYRSLDKSLLDYGDIKIWHATGDEYDKEWSKDFDIIFWTDGDRPVKVIKHGQLILELSVPQDTEVINTCGAGDTFTAAIAACLFLYDSTSIRALEKYTKIAINVCQDVISQPYTSTTTKRINKECTLQT